MHGEYSWLDDSIYIPYIIDVTNNMSAYNVIDEAYCIYRIGNSDGMLM